MNFDRVRKQGYIYLFYLSPWYLNGVITDAQKAWSVMERKKRAFVVVSRKIEERRIDAGRNSTL